MRALIVVLLLIFSFNTYAKDSYVHGYTRSNGTYVEGYHRTTPDNTVNNNYGTYGNVNPYTGAYGTKPRNEYQPQGEYNAGNGMGYGYQREKTAGTNAFGYFGQQKEDTSITQPAKHYDLYNTESNTNLYRPSNTFQNTYKPFRNTNPYGNSFGSDSESEE